MAVAARALRRAAARCPGVVAAQLKAGGSVGGVSCGEPGTRQSERDALKDKREDKGARGEPLPAASRTLHHPMHAGPRLRQNTGVTA